MAKRLADGIDGTNNLRPRNQFHQVAQVRAMIAPAITLSVPLGVPATWLVSRWVRGLMDQADTNGSNTDT